MNYRDGMAATASAAIQQTVHPVLFDLALARARDPRNPYHARNTNDFRTVPEALLGLQQAPLGKPASANLPLIIAHF